MDWKVAFLGMPGYGDCAAGAAHGFHVASKHGIKVGGEQYGLEVHKQYHQGSLLAQNFNRLWVWALNESLAGRRIDYFAMQHADVCPAPGWLDVLIEELEEQDLDVLGVVAPLKDGHGLTSIALAHESEDPYRIKCRLTMEEVYRLPETFTSEQLGRPLLLNTGLWVCRFDPSWAEQVHFTINDRIVFSRESERYHAQVESEDWNFSRQLNELGLKLGCTRKIPLEHIGPMPFTNAEPWGHMQFDAQNLSEPFLQLEKGWSFPSDVDGWLSFQEGFGLARLADGKDVLEVGSYCGRSTICMAQKAKTVTSIDPHDGRGTPKPQETYSVLLDNLQNYGVADDVTALVNTFKGALTSLCHSRFDLIFIDGAHDEESVSADIELALPLLAEGGLLAFHDYREAPGPNGRWDPGVTKNVNELLAAGGELVEKFGTVAVVKPAALVQA